MFNLYLHNLFNCIVCFAIIICIKSNIVFVVIESVLFIRPVLFKILFSTVCNKGNSTLILNDAVFLLIYLNRLCDVITFVYKISCKWVAKDPVGNVMT